MSAKIREWSNVGFSMHYTDQETLQRMAADIMSGADTVENIETPGHSYQALSRVITATSSIFPGTKYIIHVEGFTVSNITEIVEI